MRLRVLDLFCGAGGAAKGYHDGFTAAGFDVDILGVDVRPQPNYPYRFVQADAMAFPLDGFDFIHASPPCQGYSRMRHLPWLKDREYPMLIEPLRKRLLDAGVSWSIENVEDAPLSTRSDLFGAHGVLLCGRMFDLPLYRHRKFETTTPIAQPPHPRHEHVIFPGGRLNARYSGSGGIAGVISVTGHTTGVRVGAAKRALGIDWMVRDELTQAIPPAYTRFLAGQIAPALRKEAEAAS